MFAKKETVAMILAGGQGSRLGVLTNKLAKPAVPYGGKYRIIDFPLSNCVNSGIEAVGVLTQYQPLILNEYIGNGQSWDLDGMNSGVQVLPPYQRNKGADWYKGTANAIYQNMNYIDRYSPEYVVILSGDHIYKMDYSKMISEHKKNDAACTIAVLDVPLEEASRFGILNTNDDGSIYEFDEKPEKPKSTKASMGIYVFSWQKLRKYLIEDENNENSSNDFGKDVLPSMLNAGERMFSFDFEGYWKDVGTVDSLWESNMDLLDPNSELDLDDENWKIYSRNLGMPPQYIGSTADIKNAYVADGCNIYGKVDKSVLFSGVEIEDGAEVSNSIIMPGVKIKSCAIINYSIIAEDTVVEENAIVGAKPEDVKDLKEWGIAVVGDSLTIGKRANVKAKEMVYNDVEEVR